MSFLGALLALSVRAAAQDSSLPAVPYVPQSGALCGGAAASMVVRYWGGPPLRAEDFAANLNPEKTGIRAADLAEAVRGRGFQTAIVRGEPDAVRRSLREGRPLIALVKLDRGGPTFHYVVMLGWTNGRVVIHDPARGPFRVIREERWLSAWEATNRLTIVVGPSEAVATPTGAPEPMAEPAETPADLGPCAEIVGPAIEQARAGDLDGAASRLDAAIARCPSSAAPRRERAGVEFKRKNWKAAAEEARHAVALDPSDNGATRLAATSAYLAGEPGEALRLWNRLDEPRLDLVQIEGLNRMAYRSVEGGLGLNSGSLLTPDAFWRAERRIEHLPGVLAASLRYEPRSGIATIHASVAERPVLPPARWLLADAALDAALRREIGATVSNLTSVGERFDARWRFEENRPGVFVTGRSPSRLGILGVEGSWDEQSYGEGSAIVREKRRRVGVSLENWLRAGVRAEIALGVDRWNAIGTTYSVAGGAEIRLSEDRLAAEAHVERFDGAGVDSALTQSSIGLRARSSARPGVWRVAMSVSYDVASDEAPRALWPGAGTGRGRDLLLRAHPLLGDGVVSGVAFGPRLLHGSAEMERRVGALGPMAIGTALFIDAASVRNDVWRSFADWGAGVRLRFPGERAAVRVDVATAGTSSRFVVSAGWIAGWR